MVSEFLLEVLNGNWGISAVALAVISGLYVGHETLALGIGIWDWRKEASRRMRLALAVFTLSLGVGIRSIEVTRWRMMGAASGELSQLWLTAGSVLAVIGFLCCIREISKPLYGDGPWIWTLVSMVVYTAGAMALRFA